ncbi:hypothetical protein BDZ97DRAFT_1766288 [Flammula alnicola]|nr:hypothetical protein BDZ97DRAFT_1766288 [Flammula alnicola]
MAQEKLVFATITEAMAIQQLALMQSARNNANKMRWDQAMEAEMAQADEHTHNAKEAEDALITATIQEHNDILKEDKKQNKAKYLPVQGCPVPTSQPVVLSPTVKSKLTKGSWVALWHLTNKGIKHALSDPASLNTDRLDIIRDANGGMSLIPTGATKGSRAVIDDANLTWDEFMQAATRLLHHMQLKRWQKDQLHHFHYSDDPIEWHALLLYQSKQRKLWHMTVITDESYSLAKISEELVL